MPRWMDEKHEVPELPEARKDREEELFANNKGAKFLPFNLVCDKEHEKKVLSHFYTEEYTLLEVDLNDVRNTFLAWCMGEKNMSTADIRKMDVAAAKEKFKEFEEDIAKHPLYHKGKESHAGWYGEFYGKAFARLKDLTYPKQADLTTPEGIAAARNSDLFLTGMMVGIYPGSIPGVLKTDKEFNNAFDKNISQQGLADACYALNNYIYLIGMVANTDEESGPRLMCKVILENDFAPLFEGKKASESFTVSGNRKAYKYMDDVISELEKVNMNDVYKQFPRYDVEILMDNPFSKVQETEPFIADKMVTLIKNQVKKAGSFSKIRDLSTYRKEEEELLYGERADDFERKSDNAIEKNRQDYNAELKAHYDANAAKAKTYREEIFSLGETMRDTGSKLKGLKIIDEKYTQLSLDKFVDQLTMNKNLLKETADVFDNVFSKLYESQKALFDDETLGVMSGSFTEGHFNVISEDGKGIFADFRLSTEVEGYYLRLRGEENEMMKKAVILYYMSRDDFRVDYQPLVYRNDGSIYRSSKSFPIAHADLLEVNQPTDKEIFDSEEASIKSAADARKERDIEAEKDLSKRENDRSERAENRRKKRAALDEIELIKVGNTLLTEEQFLNKAYENGWKKEEDEAFLKTIAEDHIKGRKAFYGTGQKKLNSEKTLKSIVNEKLSEDHHYAERAKVLDQAYRENFDSHVRDVINSALKSCSVKLKLEKIEESRHDYENDLKEDDPKIRDFLIASYGACFNKDGTVDEELEKMRNNLYKENRNLGERLTEYKNRIMSIPQENRSPEQEKSYQAALVFDAYQNERIRREQFPDRMASLGWYSQCMAHDVYKKIMEGRKFVTDTDAFDRLMDAFEKGEHIDHPGVKISESPDAAKLTIDMMKKARDIINAGKNISKKRNDLKRFVEEIDEYIAATNYYSLAMPFENTIKALTREDMVEMGRKADHALGNMGENASEEYRQALEALKSFSEVSETLDTQMKFNYLYYDHASGPKDVFINRFIDLDAKLTTYLNMVNGEDPDMLVIWSKIAPEKAAVYADKMPAPQHENAHEDAHENANENIINDNEQVNANNNANNNEHEGNVNENVNNAQNEQPVNVNENEPDPPQMPDDRAVEVGIMNAQKEKFRIIKDNLDRVVRAYAGHTNSDEYNRMVEKLVELTGENDPDQFVRLKGELGEEARKYLDHTGLKKASHTNSEVRRKCAFLLMAYTEHPLYEHYAGEANKKRSDDYKISVNKLDSMPGVGAPAPAERNRVNIQDLANEQHVAEGGAGRERRSRRPAAGNGGPERDSNIIVNENNVERGGRKSSGPRRNSGN